MAGQATCRTGPFGPFTALLTRVNHGVMQLNRHPSRTERHSSALAKTDFLMIGSISSSSSAGTRKPVGTGRSIIAHEAHRTPSIGIAGLPNSIRVPATSDNQDYLKLLRRAEVVEWNKVGLHASVPSTSLPSAGYSRAEDWMLRIVSIISLATVGYVIMNSAWLVESWSAFTEWVKFALGA